MLFQTHARKRLFRGLFAVEIHNLESAVKLSAFLLTLMTLASCAASQPSAPATPWTISLTSSGGLAGRGNGSYAINSSGEIAITTSLGRSCSFQATEEELRRFRSLLAAASPERWKASYMPEDRCCDRFEYTLTVDEAGKVITTEWIDDPVPMPKDLTAIADALTDGASSLRVTYGPRCH